MFYHSIHRPCELSGFRVFHAFLSKNKRELLLWTHHEVSLLQQFNLILNDLGHLNGHRLTRLFRFKFLTTQFKHLYPLS
jgi:hypothetical protein